MQSMPSRPGETGALALRTPRPPGATPGHVGLGGVVAEILAVANAGGQHQCNIDVLVGGTDGGLA
jgi:hypothetical protein